MFILKGYCNISLNSSKENRAYNAWVSGYKFDGNTLLKGCKNMAFIKNNTVTITIEIRIDFFNLLALKR
jgi:hypothetical protein